MLKSYLNIGWQTWSKYVQNANAALAAKNVERVKRHIALLFGQLDALNVVLKRQQVEVEAMRESVQLQAKAAARVLAGRQAILKDMPEAIKICEEDLTRKLPAAEDIVLDEAVGSS